MKRITFSIAIVILIILLSVSCSDANRKIEAKRIEPIILNDCLITHFPGKLLVNEKYIVWQHSGASDNFLHIHSIENGAELAKAGNLGSGPKEFSTPKPFTIRNNNIYVWDLNSSKEAMISIDSAINGKLSTILLNGREKSGTHEIVSINDSVRIALRATDSTLFQLWSPLQNINFGKTPINERIENHFDIYQGNILYNDEKSLLVHTNILIPYLAIYKYKNNSFTLASENNMLDEVSVKQNFFIRNPAKLGIWASTLTKDYIACLQRDYASDNIDESTIGRDFTKAPRTIFLYDYIGNVVMKISSEYPIIRIASNTSDNNIYAIIIDEEFKIAKFEI
ncbi:BF3164 family lipoprotein [Perlabentimonas gracilis]|uniref:BF3164 family lipoprotein n=1 Tax=Perlabentimonas gracilis TaxID=2715279 RepID=UPI00140D1DCD|nr:BF3164 family lipoprotein [Perlabentimonas gracilis]NHB69254.1 hypothetical protein [Perlabentimonas gracilis]